MKSSRDTPAAVEGARFRINGRVQGVGFRWWTRRRAEELGLVGGVRNCDDGSVEIVAAGPETQLATFRRALEQGPPGSHVTSVTMSRASEVNARSFEILG